MSGRSAPPTAKMTGIVSAGSRKPAIILRRSPPVRRRCSHSADDAGDREDRRVVLEGKGQAEEHAGANHRGRPGPLDLAQEQDHGRGHGQGDERLALRSQADAADAREGRVRQEEEDERRGGAGSGGAGQPAQPIEQHGDGGCRGEIGCRHDSIVRPDRPQPGIQEMDRRRLLIPRIAVGKTARPNPLADVGVERLIRAHGLNERRQAQSEEQRARAPESAGHS